MSTRQKASYIAGRILGALVVITLGVGVIVATLLGILFLAFLGGTR